MKIEHKVEGFNLALEALIKITEETINVKAGSFFIWDDDDNKAMIFEKGQLYALNLVRDMARATRLNEVKNE